MFITSIYTEVYTCTLYKTISTRKPIIFRSVEQRNSLLNIFKNPQYYTTLMFRFQSQGLKDQSINYGRDIREQYNRPTCFELRIFCLK